MKLAYLISRPDANSDFFDGVLAGEYLINTILCGVPTWSVTAIA